ncbi:MAG TPA: four helix bundle protein [Dehalococcoidia bacterium]
MPVNSFRDLRVWQAAMNLVEQVYGLTQTFPKHELYGLAGQMQRAAVSIPSNIAEGHAREHTREYVQHISIAQASLAELQTQLEIAVRLRYLSDDRSIGVIDGISSLGRQLYGLRNALQRRSGGGSAAASSHKSVSRPLTPDPRPQQPA